MPTDGTDMKYNYSKHMYVLDVLYCKSELGIDFEISEGSMTKAKNKLLRISKAVYTYLYAFTRYYKQMEYWLANDSDLRQPILDMLEEQAIYEYNMSAEMLSMQSGVNVLTGQNIKLSNFRGEVRIAPNIPLIVQRYHLDFTGNRFLTDFKGDYTTDSY
ncbi:MAG TPA: hypothetical protein PKU69_00040 [Bacillota bacterium]|nr:hypothetical protein [Bacillota bacterium]